MILIRHLRARPARFHAMLPLAALMTAVFAAGLLLAPPTAGGAERAGELPASLATADIANGEKQYKRRCRACHTNKKGAPNKTGPNMWNIVGREQGAVEGFRYSRGLKALSGHWGYVELDRFLTRPADYVSDTRMAFPGLKKDKDRTDLIGYLRTLSDDPMPLSMN